MDIRRIVARSLVLGLVAVALSACGNDTVVAPVQTEGTGPAETVYAVTGGEQASCVTERRTVETAIEAYFAMNAADITSLDDLVPTLLKESVSARWTLTTDAATGTPAIVGTGVCEGV